MIYLCHVTLKRHKTPYKRPRFNVGRKLVLVKVLKVVAGAGTAPEAELKGVMGWELVVATVLGGVIGARVAPEADLKVVTGRKQAPEAGLRR